MSRGESLSFSQSSDDTSAKDTGNDELDQEADSQYTWKEDDKSKTLSSLGLAKIRYIASFNLANKLFGNDLSNIDTSKIRG